MKRIISLLMSVVLLFSISTETFAAYEGDKVHTYENAGCAITYSITNEWTDNHQVSVAITNNSEEILRNWAIKFDNMGTISNIWNASVLQNDGELCVIRNNGYNYEIIPGATVEFGFIQQGESLSLPENISLCNKVTDSTACVEVSYEIQNNWGEGFIAAVTVKNISDEPLEAWRLSFNGNFEISSIWNANLLYTEESLFKVENDITTTPIAVGETKTFGFQGVIASVEEPIMSDFMLTSVVIDVDAESDNSGETGESGENGETGETEEPTNPDEPIETEEPIILGFGEYIAEENAIEVYWYSTAEGTVSVYENTNDNGWVKLAEVTDEESYKYEITEEFLVKYIKVSQETESGTIESEPFIVTLTEDGYVCTWLDADEDGLPDFIEEMCGTDPEKPDTDDDGLSDYDEIYVIGTSPLKYDTDEDGTNDADSDTDGDGLTNVQELEFGTSPSSADTDGDCLSDYAELYETDTDPLKADTDGDTLSDSDDIALGLDPNDPETFGMPDAEYKVEQTISADSDALAAINTDESPYKLSIELTATGNAATSLSAANSKYSTITESAAQLGGTFDLSYISGEVEKAKLIFEIGDEYIENINGIYSEEWVDLQGIKRYNVFKYYEDINMLLPIETVIDEENNIISAEIDELGTYCVMDMDKWFYMLQGGDLSEVAPFMLMSNNAVMLAASEDSATEEEYAFTEEETRLARLENEAIEETEEVFETEAVLLSSIEAPVMLAAAVGIPSSVTGLTAVEVATPVDVVFLLQTAGALEYMFESQKDMIASVMRLLIDNFGKKNVRVCVITYDLTKASVLSPETWFTNENELIDALNTIEYNYTGEYADRGASFTKLLNSVIFKPNAAKYIVQLMNGATNVGTGYFSQIDLCATLKYNYSEFIPASYGYVSSAYEKMVANAIASTNGMNETFGSSSAIDLYEHICTYTAPPKTLYRVIVPTSWKTITLDNVLDPDNLADTDKDTLTDWNEVDTKKVRWGSDGSIALPTIRDYLDAEALKRFTMQFGGSIPSSDLSIILGTYILPIESDPTSEDGDGDLLCDKCDKAKLSSYPLPEQICEYIKEQTVDCCQLRTSDDGFVYVGESITDLLNASGIIDDDFLIYKDWHLFSISLNGITHFGLCKLRPHSATKESSFAVSFCYFDIEQFNALCCDNYDKVSIEDFLDNYINLKSFFVSGLILNYFADASNAGFYVLANEYIEAIIESEYITDHIDVYELGMYQNSVFNSLATDIEKESQCFYISDPQNLTNLEKDKILLLRSGNPSIYSFAAEIYYHARMARCLRKIIENCYNNSTVSYLDFIELLSLNKYNGILSAGELSVLGSTCFITNMSIQFSSTLKNSFLIAVCSLCNHAVVSNAGTGTSGTALIEKFLPDFFNQVNLDILIDDVFYDENSIMVQLAKEKHNEESAYNY